MTTPVDLEALEKLHAAATRGGYTALAARGTCMHAFPALVAKLRALREVAEAARPFVPVCGEDIYSDENGGGRWCGLVATHYDRMNGHEIGYLCDEHAERSREAAKKAASKGHYSALERNAPTPLEIEPRVVALVAALAKVPR